MTRAVHLELSRDLETQSFIFSFLRFINRYGLPIEVYSDNAKTSLSGSAILKPRALYFLSLDLLIVMDFLLKFTQIMLKVPCLVLPF